MKVTIRTTGEREVRAMLDEAARDVIPQGKKVVGQGCNNIKRDVKRRWSGLAHLPHLPRAIDYDVKARGSVITGEVGANRAKLQGKLAWVPEYGSPTSAPHPALAPALAAESPKFERYVGELGEKLLE
ncbi:MAG TPA: hypothetical protein VFY84_17545 [Jiangellales bacterium]|nr:hypothetical protein [Jiangellales bacterium]